MRRLNDIDRHVPINRRLISASATENVRVIIIVITVYFSGLVLTVTLPTGPDWTWLTTGTSTRTRVVVVTAACKRPNACVIIRLYPCIKVGCSPNRKRKNIFVVFFKRPPAAALDCVFCRNKVFPMIFRRDHCSLPPPSVRRMTVETYNRTGWNLSLFEALGNTKRVVRRS